MFNKSRLKEALVKYKEDFIAKRWRNEMFKWEAIKSFQDNWDVNAEDFATMLERSLEKAGKLLLSRNYFPSGMIVGFARRTPEEVRSMFIDLFDESSDVVSRILRFKDQSEFLHKRYKNGDSHYQNENAVSTYLWLRYPDKYFIYKYGEVQKIAKVLGSELHIKKGAYADNLRNFYTLYNEICEELKKDNELHELLKSQLTDSCYPDIECRTLTIDLGFYLSRYYHNEKPNIAEWYPIDYSPKLTVDDWISLLADDSVFTKASLEIMKRMKDFGGQATCKQLSLKYGESNNFYNSGSSALARRVAEKTGCPLLEKDNFRWWPILYVGREAGKDDAGSFIWKLRDELAQALDKVDLSQVELYVSTAAATGVTNVAIGG